MDVKEQEFLKRLQATFRIEAEEHLSTISAGLIELEMKATKATRRAEIIENIFREAHSLKGAAQSVNLNDAELICQPLESAFSALKREEISFSPALFDLFHQAIDFLKQLVSGLETEVSSVDNARNNKLSAQLAQAARGGALPDTPSASQSYPEILEPGIKTKAEESTASAQPEKLEESRLEPDPITSDTASSRSAVEEKIPFYRSGMEPRAPLAETVRIPISKLDPLLHQVEEMIQAKLSGGQRAVDLREIEESLISWKVDWTKWKTSHPVQSREIPEGITTDLDALIGKFRAVNQVFEQDQRALGNMVDHHLAAMKQVLMLPVSTLVEIFPKLVRDLAHDQGKEVDLTISGAEINIDKGILEELKDPLIHLVRNCIDHGIEKPQVRIQAQKPERGSLTLAFRTKNNRQVEILISDDGAGIDVEQVRAAAIKVGLISAEAAEKLDTQETLSLIFQSGVSTSKIITGISGRGLGMAIVRERVEKLGGVVSVETHENKGTTFRVLLPLTLASFRGVLVRVNERVFVLPTMQIERSLRVHLDEIQTVKNRATIRLDGQILSLVNLGNILALPSGGNGKNLTGGLTSRFASAKTAGSDYVSVLVIASAKKRIAIEVDEVLAEEEVLVKGLGQQLSRVRNISGATVLGNGKVVPVLNIADLMKSALRSGGAVRNLAAVEESSDRAKSILVAEDSITSRILLKNVLETGGYQVSTAVDGVDAITQLRSGEFDLLVSDVDMPRMSGFELTTKVRDDKKLGELPVVLVTSLDSRQDRERGFEVGANAYIIKSSFDNRKLLEVIQKLL